MAPLLVERCDYNAGSIIDNKYTVTKVLGEGSFGKVYKVTDGAGRICALKILRLWEVSPEIREPLMSRFEMEFRTGQIECENLVQSLDYGTVGGNPYIVMEFCPGGDLTQHIGKPGPIISKICHDILVGLHALHSKGKVHRDLKPENVLIKENGSASLTDFGIAGDRNKRMTERNIFGKPNQIFGTYAYMPPEQVNRKRGEATVLPTTDIFSFGVVAFQLLTGELPFGKLTSHNELAEYQRRGKDGIWSRHLLKNIQDGDKWERLLDGCLVPNFKNRIQSAKEVISMLPDFAKHELNINKPKPDSRDKNISFPQYRLRVMHGEQYGMVQSLTDYFKCGKHIITLGRDWNNTIRIKDDIDNYTSRRHCTIECDNTGMQWFVRDGQWIQEEKIWKLSSNGTYVNSKEINTIGTKLNNGDILTIGDVKILFETY